MNTPSLADVEAFLAVAGCNSFVLAARELGVAQSTVSRRISNLEARLGRQLVLRTTRKVALTDSGLTYASDLRDVMARLNSADTRLQSGLSKPEGVLRVTMPTSFGRTFVLPRIATLSTQYPDLRFEVDLSDRYVDLLDGEYDVAIRLASPAQSGVRYDKVASFGLALCASPAYFERNPAPKDLAELSAHACLAQRVYAPVISFPVTWRKKRTALQINPVISVNDSTSLRALALAGAGLAVLPLYLIEQDLKAGSLVNALPGLEFAQYEVFAAYLRHRRESEKVKVLLQALST
ncbi:LysR family transcriptional regulator [Pseudomonas sp. LB-090624]|uniref:LysR family transcriptional regulator n=1 Tax=Pseudomonas sp. LB-090624 TaxID=2213079 RepID=UPI000D80EADE|nr:LysR family transcriptional regulator [Pseudomonas sp. LB-090624]PYB78936.1 LysR family transcriptional regulator [Pseudomonas sp. LB-090624]